MKAKNRLKAIIKLCNEMIEAGSQGKFEKGMDFAFLLILQENEKNPKNKKKTKSRRRIEKALK